MFVVICYIAIESKYKRWKKHNVKIFRYFSNISHDGSMFKILELMKSGKIIIKQEELFDDIEIETVIE